MRRFQFSLESVLTIRQKALKDAQIQLASITNIYNTQKDVLEEMLFDLNNLEKGVSKYIEDGNANPDIIANYSSFSNKLSNDIRTQELIIKKTEEDLHLQQEITKQAYVKVKSLENLKDKQKEEYNKELLLEEFKELDDMATSRRNA